MKCVAVFSPLFDAQQTLRSENEMSRLWFESGDGTSDEFTRATAK